MKIILGILLLFNGCDVIKNDSIISCFNITVTSGASQQERIQIMEMFQNIQY